MTFIDYYLASCDFLQNTANFRNTFQSQSVAMLGTISVRFFHNCKMWIFDKMLNLF